MKKAYQRIKNAEPGKRFTGHYDSKKESRKEHPIKSALSLAMGIVLILVGLFFGALPLIPGFVLGIPGIAIIAARFRVVARFLDRCEMRVRRMVGKLKS